jgi:hypothetical protein
MSDLDMFKLARSMIEHEDVLANYRITWLLVFQGFLFTAFVGALNLLKEPQVRPKRLLVAGILVLLCIGIVSPLVAARAVWDAERQIQLVAQWWVEKHLTNYPKIVWNAPDGPWRLTGAMCVGALSFMWLLLLGLFWRGVQDAQRRDEGKSESDGTNSIPHT